MKNIVHGDFIKTATDSWHGLENKVKETFEYTEELVEKEVKHLVVITIDAGEKLYQYAIKGIHELGEVIKGLIDKLGIAAKDFLKWLAEKIGWTEIKIVKKHIEKVFCKGLENFPKILDVLKTNFDSSFDIIKKFDSNDFHTLTSHFNDQHYSFKQNSNHSSFKSQERHEWFFNRLITHPNVESETQNVTITPSSEDQKDLIDSIKQLFVDISNQITEDHILHEHISNLNDHILTAFDGGTAIKDLPKALFKILLDIGIIIKDVLIDTMKVLVDAFFELAKKTIKYITDFFAFEILNIPFISFLYELEFEGENLTMIGITSLLIALPSKIIADSANYDINSEMDNFYCQRFPTSEERILGLIYACNQALDGAGNALMDSVPPSFNIIPENIPDNLRPLLNPDYSPIPDNLTSSFTKILFLNSFISQFAGSPSGKLWPFSEGLHYMTYTIWTWQWTTLIALDFYFQFFVSTDPEQNEKGKRLEDRLGDFGLFLQTGAEAIHLVLFTILNLDEVVLGEEEFDFIRFTQFIDPMQGIFQSLRSKRAMVATDGTSYLVVPATDAGFQLIYSLGYATGALAS